MALLLPQVPAKPVGARVVRFGVTEEAPEPRPSRLTQTFEERRDKNRTHTKAWKAANRDHVLKYHRERRRRLRAR